MQVDKGILEPRASALGKPLCSLQKLESWGKRAPDYTLPSTPKTFARLWTCFFEISKGKLEWETTWTTQIYCRARSHQWHWSSSVRIQTQGKCMYCSLQASLCPGWFLFSCIAVKTFSMWASFSAACSASACTMFWEGWLDFWSTGPNEPIWWIHSFRSSLYPIYFWKYNALQGKDLDVVMPSVYLQCIQKVNLTCG